jgi:hypothetical protein
MSQRQLKKLRRQQEALGVEEKVKAPGGEDGSDSDEQPIPTRAKKNPFSGFAALAEAEDEDKGDEQDDTTAEEEHPEPAVAQAATKKSSKKSKKKKKKKAQKADADSGARAAAGPDEDMDDIDRALAELKVAHGVSAAPGGPDSTLETDAADEINNLLRINFYHLKAMNEMRKLFGRDSMAMANSETNAPAAQPIQGEDGQQHVDLATLLQAPPGRGMLETIRKRNVFIEGKATWPRGSSGGLAMESLTPDESGGVVEFMFTHTETYAQLEVEFYRRVMSYDPQQIIQFLYQNPYHISSLIQGSKIAKQQGQDAALGTDLCERALFTMGRVSLSLFRKKLEMGQARLDFYRPENRQFFLAGHSYIGNLVMRGTYRTALEWAKLYLSVAPEDPFDVMNWIHVLAVRTREAQWFIDLCASDLLACSENYGNVQYIKQTMVISSLQLGDKDGARKLVEQGMNDLPWLYGALFSALNMDTPRSIWGKQPRDQEEELHTNLYIHMAKDLWDRPEAIALLKEVGNSDLKGGRSPPAPIPVSLGTARFVYLDNTPSLMACVPRGMLNADPNYDFDPLPPPLELNRFSNRWQRVQWGRDGETLRNAEVDEIERLVLGITHGDDDASRAGALDEHLRAAGEATRPRDLGVQNFIQHLRAMIMGTQARPTVENPDEDDGDDEEHEETSSTDEHDDEMQR